MKKNSACLDLVGIENGSGLAADVHYQAALISNQLEYKHSAQLCRQFHALFGSPLRVFRA